MGHYIYLYTVLKENKMAKVTDEYPGQLSDEDLKKSLINDVIQSGEDINKASTSKFPTETIELPSKGLVYPPDSPLSTGKVEMKYMTAKEEDILTSQNLIKKGLVIDALLKSLIVTPINYNDLVVGDKNAIMVAARILGYGADYPVEIQCPACGEKNKLNVNLTELTEKGLDENDYTAGQNSFTFVLPASKKTITWKLLTHGDEGKIETMVKSTKKRRLSSSVNPEMSTRFKYMITAVDGDETVKTIHDFVDNEFLSRDTLAFRKEIERLSPDIDMSFYFQCDNCEHEVDDMQVPMTVEFFWPRA